MQDILAQMRLNDTHRRIIADIAVECTRHNVSFLLDRNKKVRLPNEPKEAGANGFFAEEDLVLAVATGKPLKQWFWVLLHEYNHMQQWLEGKFFTQKSAEADTILWDWVFGKEDFSQKKIAWAVEMQRACELDCERRTAQMLADEPEIGLDPIYYIQKSNAYLYFYTMIKRHRKWYKTAPYDVPGIVELMPDRFLKSYNRVPKDYQELVLENCFGD